MRTWLRGCAVALVLGTVAGCGTSSADSERIAELEERVEAAESQAAAAVEEETETETAAMTEDVADEVTEDEPVEEEPSAGDDCIKVPNVVGKDHQLAQDTMQAAGLYHLNERDASGQDRMLLLDRNWTTVKQRPKAGDCVPDDTEIMLSAVKDDER